MKKFFAVIAVAFASVVVANAQIGIVAGVTSSTAKIDKENIENNMSGIDQYHVGVALKLPLPLGFAIQPELLYQIKGADLKETYDKLGSGAEIETSSWNTKSGFAELGIGIQWGLDLVAFRPFVFAKPFVGYMINGEGEYNGAADVLKEGTDKYLEDAKNKLEYGFSVGAGLELLEHFQLSFEFFNNLGQMFDEGQFNKDKATEAVVNNYKDLENYSGFKVTLGFLF
ncbi:MAG: PorT family protein [Bacteroidales bacterium]|nr:PorT family protein [Bacteroidales bacterium]